MLHSFGKEHSHDAFVERESESNGPDGEVQRVGRILRKAVEHLRGGDSAVPSHPPLQLDGEVLGGAAPGPGGEPNRPRCLAAVDAAPGDGVEHRPNVPVSRALPGGERRPVEARPVLRDEVMKHGGCVLCSRHARRRSRRDECQRRDRAECGESWPHERGARTRESRHQFTVSEIVASAAAADEPFSSTELLQTAAARPSIV